MIEIDGSAGEGGGQILRVALAFSCISGKSVRISNIRAGRKNPGIAPQHLAVCNLLSKISNAQVEGARLGSTKLVFHPGELSGGNFEVEIGTAGACTLVLQAALPIMLCCKGECSLKVIGGTHVSGAPTYDYFENVLLPAIGKFGARCQARMERAGFYPKGGGSVFVKTFPSRLQGFRFLHSKPEHASYKIVSASIPEHVAKREERVLKDRLAGIGISGRIDSFNTLSPGNAITIWGGNYGASAIGERGKSAEQVANEACDSFMSEAFSANSSVDSHLADQLLIYATMAKGSSLFYPPKITSHLSTAAFLLSKISERDIRIGMDGIVEVV
ncbi:MAG: RNA 3'-terminal phosphate cyclase [Candidatus Anstonellaceae archaeon]